MFKQTLRLTYFVYKKVDKEIYKLYLKKEANNMKLLFKQRIFSWLDSYDVYDENKNTIYKVKGELSWGHQLRIYDSLGNEVGLIKEKIITILPKFIMYKSGEKIGEIQKELTLFSPKFNLTCNDWKVKGDIFEWEYEVEDSNKNTIAIISKKLFNLTDTYEINIIDKENALYSLMIVLAIDAAKCTKQKNQED